MRRRILPITLAALAATASVATAQALNDNHDRGPAAGVIRDYDCGPEQRNFVRTQSQQGGTSNTNPEPIPATIRQFTVPPGQTACVKVLWTAETSCTGAPGPDYCRVQALIDGAPMDPDGAGYMTIDSEDATGDGHAFEWIKRVGPGQHTLLLTRAVDDPATTFTHDDWTLDVTLKS